MSSGCRSECRAPTTREVGCLQAIGIDHNKLAHPKARQVLDKKRPGTTGADHRDPLGCKEGLAAVAEESCLAVVALVGLCR